MHSHTCICARNLSHVIHTCALNYQFRDKLVCKTLRMHFGFFCLVASIQDGPITYRRTIIGSSIQFQRFLKWPTLPRKSSQYVGNLHRKTLRTRSSFVYSKMLDLDLAKPAQTVMRRLPKLISYAKYYNDIRMQRYFGGLCVTVIISLLLESS